MRGRERGQALALFALTLTVLLGMASVAIDVGRMLAQQRYMQNAADAAALSAAQTAVALSGTTSAGTVASARAAATRMLALNLGKSPAGVAAFTAAATPVYSSGNAPRNLVDGIIFVDYAGVTLADNQGVAKIAEIRVALRAPVPFLLGRVIGVPTGTARARSRVGMTGQGAVLPIAVRRYINGAGPNNPVPNPCVEPNSSGGRNKFYDIAASRTTSCRGVLDANPLGYDIRSPASLSAQGPTIQLVGQGAQANAGGISFRGFVNLDIREFKDANRVFYNGVSTQANTNSMKPVSYTHLTLPTKA